MKLGQTNVLITGASRGLGAALARELASQGAGLALVARDAVRLTALARSLSQGGARAHALVADLADKRAIHPLAAQAQALLGSVDVVVHNASTLGPRELALLADTECEDFGRALELNVLGAFRLSRALLPGMLLRGAGALVHVSSDAAVSAYPRWGAYGVTKAALDHLSRSWAAELEGTGVAVFAVDPGEMDTDMHHQAVPDADRTKLLRPEHVARQIVRLIGAAASLHGRRVGAEEGAP